MYDKHRAHAGGRVGRNTGMAYLALPGNASDAEEQRSASDVGLSVSWLPSADTDHATREGEQTAYVRSRRE